jgi:stress response protein YsnF
MATRPTTGTYALNELGEFTVADGAPDPRGWPVYAADRRQVGTVEDLLVDLDAMRVRYLDVRVEGAVMDAGRGPERVLIPVGLARVLDDADRLVLDATTAQVLALPEYVRGGAVRRDHEDGVLRRLGRGEGATAAAATAGPQFYERPEFDTGRLQNRGARAGAPAAAAPGDAVRVVAMAEEPVITKRLVVREVLVIKRRRVVEPQTVEVDLRWERVEVDRQAAPGA